MGTVNEDTAAEGSGVAAQQGTPGRAMAISAHGICAGFGGRPYLSGVDFHAEAGEVVAVLGANGAGKTTLLMTLAGHLAPTAGEVRIGGDKARPSMERRVREQGIAVITQERSVFMTLNVRQNIALGGGSVQSALELFPELEPHLSRQVGMLSGGQQQMLAVARALQGSPRVILADELSLGLGPKIVDRLLEVLTLEARRHETAVVIVEQHTEKALASADRCYVMQRGRIAYEASSDVARRERKEISSLYL